MRNQKVNATMNEKSEMEILYEQYQRDTKRFREKDNIVFYKIINKSCFAGKVLVTVPGEAVYRISDSYRDENGKRLIFEEPVHIRFGGGEIPDWYVETVTLPVKDISDIYEIGEYLGRL